MYQKIKLSQPYLCCLSPIVQPPDIKTTSWYKQWGGEKEIKVFEFIQLGPWRHDDGRKKGTNNLPGFWMAVGDREATHLPKETLPLHPQGKAQPCRQFQ